LIKFFADVRNFLVKVTLHLDKAEATVNENNKGVAAKKFMLKLQFGSDSGKFADFAVPSVWEAVGMMQGRIDKLQKGTKRFLGGTKSAMEAVIASLKGSATGDGALHATQEVDRMREELERLAGRVNVTPIFIECLMFASYGDTQEWVR